jgi:hypothetical protein
MSLTTFLVTGDIYTFGKGCLNTTVRNLRASLQSVVGLFFVCGGGDTK